MGFIIYEVLIVIKDSKMPFRQLFAKREQRTFSGIKKETIVPSISNFWSQSQFGITFTGPFQIHGERLYSKIGLRQVVDVWIQDSGDAVMVDIMFSANLGEGEAVIGAVGAVVILPVAVAVGAVSYLEYENDAKSLIASFWNFLTSLVFSSGGRASSQPLIKPVPKATVSCPNCGLPQEGGSFCKHCGTKLA